MAGTAPQQQQQQADKAVVIEPGTPEYDKAMADKFDQTTSQSQGTTPEVDAKADRPEWLPEGIDTPEDLAKAYAALKAGKTEGDTTQEETPDGEPEVDPAKEALSQAGLDFDALQDEFDKNGVLSAESYAALAEKGFTKDLVDNYVEGRKASSELFLAKAYAAAGGEDQFTVITGWAGTNLTAAEITEFNAQVTKGTPEAATLAITALKAKYDAANGTDPKLVNGSASTAPQGYASRKQMTSDMRDPRYASDPAFRAEVERKISLSKGLF